MLVNILHLGMERGDQEAIRSIFWRTVTKLYKSFSSFRTFLQPSKNAAMFSICLKADGSADIWRVTVPGYKALRKLMEEVEQLADSRRRARPHYSEYHYYLYGLQRGDAITGSVGKQAR